MNGKKYILHPGLIQSINDREWHRINSAELAALYHVPLHECWIVTTETDAYAISSEEWHALPHLYPDPWGRYEMPPSPNERRPSA